MTMMRTVAADMATLTKKNMNAVADIIMKNIMNAAADIIMKKNMSAAVEMTMKKSMSAAVVMNMMTIMNVAMEDIITAIMRMKSIIMKDIIITETMNITIMKIIMEAAAAIIITIMTMAIITQTRCSQAGAARLSRFIKRKRLKIS